MSTKFSNGTKRKKCHLPEVKSKRRAEMLKKQLKRKAEREAAGSKNKQKKLRKRIAA